MYLCSPGGISRSLLVFGGIKAIVPSVNTTEAHVERVKFIMIPLRRNSQQ